MPTVIVPERAPSVVRRALVGVDGSEQSARALDWAVSHARSQGAAVEAVRSAGAVATLDPLGMRIVHVLPGSPAEAAGFQRGDAPARTGFESGCTAGWSIGCRQAEL